MLLEYVNERSLADACLSGDKNGLSLAPQSAGETDVKFSKGGLATDDSLCVGAWERGCTFVAHRSDELVSPSGKGLNIQTVTKRTARLKQKRRSGFRSVFFLFW